MKPFHELLTLAIHRIGRYEGKRIGQIQDEVGRAIGKSGRHSIEHWRKAGNRPYKIADLENLARELIRGSTDIAATEDNG